MKWLKLGPVRTIRLSVLTAVTVVLLSVSVAVAQQPTILQVTLQDFQETASREAIQEIIVPAFEANHPGVEVDVSWISWSDYIEQYVTLYLGGLLPDVVSIGSAGLGTFYESGIIREIDDYMRNWPGLEDTVPAAIEDVQINGTFYAVPYRLDVRTLTYNMNYFDDAGIDRFTPPQTWDELTTYARMLAQHDADGFMTVQGYDVRDDIYHVLPFIFQAGGDYISADGTRTLIDQDEAVEAVTYLHDLIYEHNASVPAGGNLLNGVVAMQHNSTWLMRPQYQGGFDIGIAEPTRYRGQATQVHINRFAIGSTSEHPDLAWAWIEHFMEPENLQRVVVASMPIPGRISVLRMEPFTEDPRWDTWLRAALVSRPIPGYVPSLGQVNARTRDALELIFENAQPVRTALEEAAADINRNILNQN